MSCSAIIYTASGCISYFDFVQIVQWSIQFIEIHFSFLWILRRMWACVILGFDELFSDLIISSVYFRSLETDKATVLFVIRFFSFFLLWVNVYTVTAPLQRTINKAICRQMNEVILYVMSFWMCFFLYYICDFCLTPPITNRPFSTSVYLLWFIELWLLIIDDDILPIHFMCTIPLIRLQIVDVSLFAKEYYVHALTLRYGRIVNTNLFYAPIFMNFANLHLVSVTVYMIKSIHQSGENKNHSFDGGHVLGLGYVNFCVTCIYADWKIYIDIILLILLMPVYVWLRNCLLCGTLLVHSYEF